MVFLLHVTTWVVLEPWSHIFKIDTNFCEVMRNAPQHWISILGRHTWFLFLRERWVHLGWLLNHIFFTSHTKLNIFPLLSYKGLWYLQCSQKGYFWSFDKKDFLVKASSIVFLPPTITGVFRVLGNLDKNNNFIIYLCICMFESYMIFPL